MSISLGLQRVSLLLKHLGSPHLKVPMVHITGTNGKGSVSAFLDAILCAAGLRTGRFNSPHLVDVNDAFLITGEPVPRGTYDAIEELVRSADAAHATQATPFELQTAVAYKLFERQRPPLDIAIIEVGMGGAEDATNVVPNPLLSIITSIDLDHQAFLGNAIEEIAQVKGGIIKPSCPCLLGVQTHPSVVKVVQGIAHDLEAPLWLVSPSSEVMGLKEAKFDVQLSLKGTHQVQNASIAVCAAQLLRSRFPSITDAAIKQGLETAQWPGRLDWVSLPSAGAPQILVDGAHNPSSAETLKDYLNTLPEQDTTFIIALSGNRSAESILQPLLSDRPRSRVVATRFTPPDNMPWVTSQDPKLIATTAQQLGAESGTATDLSEALQAAAQAPTDRIVVAGSLYLAADVYRMQRPFQNRR